MLICFCVGIALGDSLRIAPWIPAGLGVFAALAGVFVVGGAWPRLACAWVVMLATGCLAIGASAGPSGADDWLAVEATVEGEVCRFDRGADWFAVELCEVRFVEGRQPAGLSRIRLVERVDHRLPEAFRVFSGGEVLRARVRVEPRVPLRNPGAQDGGRASRRRGVGAMARLVDPLWLSRVEFSERVDRLTRLRIWVDARRNRIGERLEALGPGGGLLSALGVGDRSRLPAQAEAAFARLGVAHLLAVSGLHLYLVAGFAYTASWFVVSGSSRISAGGDPRRMALAFAALTAVGYALLAGWGIPIRRALLMLLALGAGFVAQRVSTGINGLALAGLLILVHDPSALFAPGAQLSFAATAGLMLCVRSGSDSQDVGAGPSRGRRVLVWFHESLRVSAVAIAVTAPIVASHGWAQSGFGLLGNLALVPLASLLLLPASLVASLLAAMPSFAAAELWLNGAAYLAASVETAVIGVAAWLPDFQGIGEPAISTWLLASLVSVLALSRRSLGGVLVCCALVLAILAIGPRQGPELSYGPRLVVLEVGHGDAIVVQGQGAAVLVDAGRGSAAGRLPGASAVVSALAALGISELDAVIATHADHDHRGGIDAVLRALPVDELWLPYGGEQDPAFDGLRALAEKVGTRVVEHGAGDPPERRGDLSLTALWPPRVWTPGMRNEGSLVVRVEREGFSVLLTGDAGLPSEAQLLARGVDLESTVLKVGHHGSRGSSSSAFLRAVSPEVAIVSAGCSLRRGLPSVEALARVRAAGAATWWTARDGAVVIPLEHPVRVWGWTPDAIARGCGRSVRY